MLGTFQTISCSLTSKRIFNFPLQSSATHYDVCSALTFDPCHSVALAMKAELEELAQQCKNQVSQSPSCPP